MTYDELEHLNQIAAQNRRKAEFNGIARMAVELMGLVAAAAVLVTMAYAGRIPDWWTIALVLAGTGCVFFRLGRFVGGF